MEKDFEKEIVEQEATLGELEGKDTKEAEKESSKLDIFDTAQSIISAFVVGILIFIFVFRVIGVKGDSMYPTLHNGDRVVSSGVFYNPEVGDIIILKSDYYTQPLVKRIIAVENQTIDIDFEKGIVYVNGTEIYEPYIAEATHIDEGFEGPVTVP